MRRPIRALPVLAAVAALAACSSVVGGHGGPATASRSGSRDRLTASASAAGTRGGAFGPSGPVTPSGSATPASSSNTGPTVTVTVSPSAPATVVSGSPGIFVGTWTGHGRRLVVHGDGSARVDYRLYRTCGTDPPPCDRIVGNAIIDGGHVSLQTMQVVTANHRSTLTATVLTSTDPTFRVGSTQTFTLDGDIITSAWATFCDARSDGQCGA